MALHTVTSLDEASKARLCAFILRSQLRRACLRALRAAGPRDAWLAAGFIRNAVFDEKLGPSRLSAQADLDVVYNDPLDLRGERDRAFEFALNARCPGPWSVKNQARMAIRNGHGGYRDVEHAISHFPERATAVAARLSIAQCELELLAPFGIDDLCAGVIRATPNADLDVYFARCRDKRWLDRWPDVRVLSQ